MFFTTGSLYVRVFVMLLCASNRWVGIAFYWHLNTIFKAAPLLDYCVVLAMLTLWGKVEPFEKFKRVWKTEFRRLATTMVRHHGSFHGTLSPSNDLQASELTSALVSVTNQIIINDSSHCVVVVLKSIHTVFPRSYRAILAGRDPRIRCQRVKLFPQRQ